jgi:hypothetical protein
MILPSAAPQPDGFVCITEDIAGLGCTVTTTDAVQPGLVVYTIVDVPGVIPVTMPVPAPTTATPGVLLVQVPPGMALVRVELMPTHTSADPDIVPGIAITVTIVVA